MKLVHIGSSVESRILFSESLIKNQYKLKHKKEIREGKEIEKVRAMH